MSRKCQVDRQTSKGPEPVSLGEGIAPIEDSIGIKQTSICVEIDETDNVASAGIVQLGRFVACVIFEA